ncbi:MAG: cytochrome c [Chloroflexi bacterium]|nr:cytochrome c [Chloroflexota bacterium]
MALIPVAGVFLLAACGGATPPTATPVPPAPTRAPTVAPTATSAPPAVAPTAAPPAATRPAATSGDAARGKALYTAKGCNACHGANGEGAPGIGPKLVGIYGKPEAMTEGSAVTVDDAYITESIKVPTAKVVKGFNPIMPVIALTDAEIKDLVAFVASLK